MGFYSERPDNKDGKKFDGVFPNRTRFLVGKIQYLAYVNDPLLVLLARIRLAVEFADDGTRLHVRRCCLDLMPRLLDAETGAELVANGGGRRRWWRVLDRRGVMWRDDLVEVT